MEKKENPGEILSSEWLPTVALRNMTVFPHMILHFDLNRERSIVAIEQAMMKDQILFLSAQKDAQIETPAQEDVYEIGTVVVIKQVSKLPGGIVRVLVEGLARARLQALEETLTEPGQDVYLMAEVLRLKEEELQTPEDVLRNQAMLRSVQELFESYALHYPKIGKGLVRHIEEADRLGHLLDQMVINMPLSFQKKQSILEAVEVSVRYEEMVKILTTEIEIAKLKGELTEQVRDKVEQNQKEFLLREQLKYIRRELGEEDTVSDADHYREALAKLDAPKEVKEKLAKEINRFKNLSANSSESAVERGYIETLLELPWNKRSVDNLDLQAAEDKLNADHYGLEKVKERMLEFLAVRALAAKSGTSIICLVGPPGTGKTSIARSVAEALHKKYVRISLGGVRDEAEIRGHRKTYVGAMPGRIVAGLKQAGVRNPLMLLDEIDKVSNDYKGDTFSALLEVLDSEQNKNFRDHYVEVPVDLSEVFFIATANTTATIPRPLLDRMEIIEVTSYTANEKLHIAKEHLLDKQLAKNGLTGKGVTITDSALKAIIAYYTKEAGVRSLERCIGEICRKAARQILCQASAEAMEPAAGQRTTEGVLESAAGRGSGKAADAGIRITGQNLSKYLGKKKYLQKHINEANEVGIVRGLAWTSVGGDTLQIEVNCMPGKGVIELTGQLGDVMKESARTALSYIRSISKKYQIKEAFFKNKDFHIHIPEGAVPKDGPSAGITMATALLSAITEIPVRADIAMTGEITLRGRVLPIGGLKEKILAAKTAGVRTVLVPKQNEKDVTEVSAEIKSGIEIIYVEHMEQVIQEAFVMDDRDVEKRKKDDN